MSEIAVREAERRDVDFIAQAQLDMALETENRRLDADRVHNGVASVFDHPGCGHYFVAELAGRAVGCLLVTFEWSDWRNGTFYWIQSAFVQQEFRKRGVFTALYHHVEEVARKEGCGVRLYVDAANQTGQRTYERLGMTRTNYIVYETDFIYESH